MPQISFFVPHGRAMSRPRHKSPGLIGIRVIFRQHKRAKRCISYINTVRINIILCPRTGILKVIFPLILIHPDSFYIRLITKHPSDQRNIFFGNPFFGSRFLSPEKSFQRCVNLCFTFGIFAMVFPHTFIPFAPRIAFNQYFPLS